MKYVTCGIQCVYMGTDLVASSHTPLSVENNVAFVVLQTCWVLCLSGVVQAGFALVMSSLN